MNEQQVKYDTILIEKTLDNTEVKGKSKIVSDLKYFGDT